MLHIEIVRNIYLFILFFKFYFIYLFSVAEK